MLRTPETPSMPRYRAGKSSAFTPQSRRAVQTPRERERRERERARQRERDCSTSSDRMRRLERKKRFENPSDVTSPPTSPIVMLRVGPQKRLFAAHEAILSISPFFAAQIQSQNHIQVQAQIQTPTPTPSRARTPPRNKLIDLPEEQAEVLSCILEFLYKGDYYPRLRHNANKQTWELEDADLNPSSSDGDGDLSAGAMATVYHHQAGCVILRDTAVYCAATKYALPTLQRLALRKQGLHTNISVSTILASARFAYANTPDTESRLRAHYLALIVRSRSTFMRSGTMQMEMEKGGLLFFDLFVALCNHMDDYDPGELGSGSVSTTC